MELNAAKEAVFQYLCEHGKATNTQLLRLLKENEPLLQEVRESLILDDLADDKNGVGLVLAAGVDDSRSPSGKRPQVFLSYGRRDAKALADRLQRDLGQLGFDVWLDTQKLKSGDSWQHDIADGLRTSQVVVALLSPHSVRVSEKSDGIDSVCLGEIAYAMFRSPPTPVVPVMAKQCDPPLAIFHLDYVDLCRWNDSESQYQAGLGRLVEGVRAALRGEKRYRSWYHSLKPWDFASFFQEKRRNFTGRRWLFEDIDAWRESSQEKALLIVGAPGVGKSTFVAELIHQNPQGQVLAYHCCQSDTPATLESWRFVRSIAAMIASQSPHYAAALDDPEIQELLSEPSCRKDPATPLERGVFGILESLPAPEQGVRYIIVDALDEALTLGEGVTIVQLLASRIGRMPRWLRIVATTRRSPEVLNRLRGLRAKEISAADARNLEDVAEYIRVRTETPNISAVIAQTGRSVPEVAGQLIASCEGSFLYARQILDGLESGLHKIDQLSTLPPGVYGLYDEFFRRSFGEKGEHFAKPRQVLEVVVAAREPLSIEELSGATSLDAQRELPGILNRLAEFLPKHVDHEGHVKFSTFHASLVDWLTDPELLGTTFSVIAEGGHTRLAEWGIREYRNGVKSMSPYTLRHTLRHLIEAKSWDGVADVATSLLYFERRNENHQLYELAIELGVVVCEMPIGHPARNVLRLLHEALRRDIHFVAKHAKDYPQGLFQCLWNHGWWHEDENESTTTWPEANAASGYVETHRSLRQILEEWKAEREQRHPGFPWIRSRLAPIEPLGTPLVSALHGHTTDIGCVCYSPNGATMASGSLSGEIKIWDAASEAELLDISGEWGAVYCLAFSPDGRQLAAATNDHLLRIWSVDSGELEMVFTGHQKLVSAVCYSRDGKYLLSGSFDWTVRIWNAKSGEELVCIQEHDSSQYSPDSRVIPSQFSGSIRSIACSPDFQTIAAGAVNGLLRIWSIEERNDSGSNPFIYQCTHEIKEKDRINSLAFSHDGKFLISGCSDFQVRMYEATSGKNLAEMEGHEDIVFGVAISPDDSQISSASKDSTVRLWSVETKECIKTWKSDHRFGVRAVAFSHNGKRVAAAASDGVIRVWDTEGDCVPSVPQGHNDLIRKIHFSGDGSRVVSYSKGRFNLRRGDVPASLRVWDTRSGRELLVITHEESIDCFDLTPDGKLLATGYNDRSLPEYYHTVRLWDVNAGVQLAIMLGHRLEQVTNAGVRSVSISKDGRRIVSSATDGTIRVWDTKSSQELAVLHGHTIIADSKRLFPVVRHMAALSNDESFIVSGGGDGTVQVWDAHSYERRFVMRGHETEIVALAISPDDSVVASSASNGEIRLWNPLSGQEVAVLVGHEEFAYAVRFSSDGQWLTSISARDHSRRLWDVDSGECIQVTNLASSTDTVFYKSQRVRIDAQARETETVFQVHGVDNGTGFFPVRFGVIEQHPFEVAWAASSNRHIYIVELEGWFDAVTPAGA